ncbi:MAG: molybdenum cofactor biosynthesis protein MoaE [Nitrospirae bacterium]|nr:molybdenum cofactor biosynthesis protein MoaE [Nitrospirota bacterium]
MEDRPRHLTRRELRQEELLPRSGDPECGATVIFSGTVRRANQGRTVSSIDYEAEERLADAALSQIFEEMERTAGGPGVLIHRLGRVPVGEASIFISASSAHRDQAFRAVRDAIEAVKVRVPIWKKEHYEDGSSEWLDGKPLQSAPQSEKEIQT